MDEHLERLAQLLRDTRADTLALLGGTDDLDLPVPGDESRWRLRDLIAHLAAWDAASAEAVRAYCRGETDWRPPDYTGVDAFNAREVKARRSLGSAALRAALDEAHEAFVGAVLGVPPDQLAGEFRLPWGPRADLTALVEGMAAHERSHRRDIRRAVRAG